MMHTDDWLSQDSGVCFRIHQNEYGVVDFWQREIPNLGHLLFLAFQKYDV